MTRVLNKQTNKWVDIDNGLVVDALKSGQYDIDLGTDIHVADPNGGYGTIKAGDLAQAEQAGFTVIDNKSIRQRELQDEYGDPLHTAEAFVTETLDESIGFGVGKGLAVAATEAIGGKQAAKDLREHFQNVEEANPIADWAGAITGNIVGAYGTGGTATAAKGLLKGGLKVAGKEILQEGAELAAKEVLKEGSKLVVKEGGESLLKRGLGIAGDAVLAPSRALEGAGGLAERAIGKIVGTEAVGTFGRMAQTGARMGARGATEGALYGAINEVGTAYMNDTPLTGEKLLTAAGHGAIIGGVFGISLGVGGEMASATMNKLSGAGVGTGIKNLYAKISSKISGRDEETIRRIMDDPDYQKVLRGNGKEIKDEAAKNIRKELDTVLEALDKISDEAKGASKFGNVKETVALGNESATVKAVQMQMDVLKTNVRNMLADGEAYGEIARLKELRGALNHAETNIQKAMIDGGEQLNAKLFWEIDNLKKAWGNEAQIGGRMLPPGRDGATLSKLQMLYDGELRPFLENSNLWGKAGENQAKVNKAWSQLIDAQRFAGKELLTPVGRDTAIDNWRSIYRVDTAKLDKYLNGLTDPKSDLAHEFVTRFVSQSKEFLGAIKEAYKIPEKQMPLLEKAFGAVNRLSNETGKVEKILSATNKINALRVAENDSLATKALGLLNPVTGAVLGGGIGTAVATAGRLAATPFVQPIKTLTAIVGMNDAVQKISKRMDSGVIGFFATAAKAAAKRGAPAYMIREQVKHDDKKIDKKNGIPAATPASIYAEKKNALDAIKKNPAILTQRVDGVTGPLQQHAPKAAESFRATAVRATAFLDSKMPKPPSQKVGAGTLKTVEWQPTKPEMAKFARYAKAVDDPLSVVDGLANGEMNREGVEALKVVYPEMHAELKTKFMDEINKASEPLPYQARLQLSILLDIPADYTLQPEFIARTQASYANKEQEKEQSSGSAKIDVSKRIRGISSLSSELAEV